MSWEDFSGLKEAQSFWLLSVRKSLGVVVLDRVALANNKEQAILGRIALSCIGNHVVRRYAPYLARTVVGAVVVVRGAVGGRGDAGTGR